MKTTFDAAWKGWIQENISAGRDRNGIFKILLDEGYAFEAIAREMNFVPTLPAQLLVNPLRKQASTEDYGNTIARGTLFIPNGRKFTVAGCEGYWLEDFLSDDELDSAVKQVTADSSSGGDSDLDRRICQLVGLHPAYGEALWLPSSANATAADMESEVAMTMFICLQALTDLSEPLHGDIGAIRELTAGSVLICTQVQPHALLSALAPAGEPMVAIKVFRNRLVQPLPSVPSMYTKEANEYVPNYTLSGIERTRLPDALFAEVRAYLTANRQQCSDEHIPGDFVYKSDGGSRSSSLVELSPALRQKIHDTLKPMMEAWCGQTLEPTYVYGIRIYHDKAVLKFHRDRLETHIISAIINVDQKVRTDWPLEIDDNYCRRHQVILAPGDVVFYEGARLEHGRPEPLDGEFFANVFCHFKPAGYVPCRLAD